MTVNLPPRVVAGHRGMSLFELTVVIATLLAFVAILMVGSRAWRHGSDRAGCVLNLRDVQAAVRSYQNMYGYNAGGRPFAENGTQDIAFHLFQKGYIEQGLFNVTQGADPCPSGGVCECGVPDVFPEPGKLFMNCSLADSHEHQPRSHADW